MELVNETARKLSNLIAGDWHWLNVIEKLHGDSISARWKKRSPAKRRELLCTILPGIPATHRPEMEDPHFYCRCNSCSCGATQRPRSSELWPYINLEDLSDAKSLLDIIKARALNRPATFTSSELSFSPLAAPSNSNQLALPGISFSDQDPETQEYKEKLYGRVVDPRGSQCVAVNEVPPIYFLGIGLQILRIQSGLLWFLVSCCFNIMHDVPQDMLIASMNATTFVPPSLSFQENVSSVLTDAGMKAAYCARGMPDCTRIRHLISTVLGSIKDHAWALREDPAYFAETIQDYADHHHENLLNKAGEPSERLATTNFNSRVLREVLSTAYGSLITWDQLHQESLRLEALHRSLLSGDTTEETSKRYLEAMKVVYYLLLCCKESAAGFLRYFSMGAPNCVTSMSGNPKKEHPITQLCWSRLMMSLVAGC